MPYMDYASYFFGELALYRYKMFEAHSIHLLKEMLDPWAKSYLLEKGFKNTVDRNYLALIIDDRVTPLIRFSILNTLLMCRLKIRVQIFTTSIKLDEMRALFRDLTDWIEILPIEGINSVDKISYNELLKSQHFWSALTSQKLLVFQTDSLLIEPIDFTLFKLLSL